MKEEIEKETRWKVDPYTLKGKYVGYDNDHGACWAKIDSIAKSGKDVLLITKLLRVRSNGSIQTFTDTRCLIWKVISSGNYRVFDIDGDSLTGNKTVEDEIFVAFLAGGETDGNSIELGANELCKVLGKNNTLIKNRRKDENLKIE